MQVRVCGEKEVREKEKRWEENEDSENKARPRRLSEKVNRGGDGG